MDLTAVRVGSLDDIRKEQARRSLHAFLRLFWPYMDPAEFQDGWHIGAVCEHLEAVTSGEIRNLLITIPPRHVKSSSAAVAWPAWSWIDHPGLQWLFASYHQNLSTRDSVKCRRVVKSDQYQRWFGDSITLVGDSNQKTRFDNTAGGYRIATSVSGEGTGHGGDIIVADDPHNVKEGESDKKREEVLTWWDEAMSTRLNNPKTGRKVIIQQRVHENDLAGHVLEAGGYDHLDLPARFERDRRCVTSIGWSDPRQDEGEPLWAERFGEAELSRLEKDLGPYGAAAQLQQRPSPREGGMIKRAWFPIISRGPSEATWIRYWDLAATEKTAKNDPDRTAGALLAYKNGLLYIEDIIAVREGPANVEEIIKQTARMDGRRVKVWMEQEPGASGKNTIHHYRKLLRGYAFDGDRTSGPKESYVDILAGAAKAGDVLMVEGEWNAEFLREAEVFPFGAHDDMLDSVAKGYAKLTGGNLAGAW